jgi:UDP-N-acetyl-D-glucosamine dehydrogenase
MTASALPPSIAALVARLEGQRPVIAVVGLGYVGLPLCVELARSGAEVLGLDVSEGLCNQLNEGRSHVGDISDADLAEAVRSGFSAGVDAARVARADAIIICVPTPLRKTKDPDISYIVAAGQAIAAHARSGQLVVLESTTYPGTTEEILVPMLEARGLTPGVDVAVAFSPERVDPGNPKYGIRNTPKVVGGLTPACSAAAAALYGRCCDRVHPVSSPAAAETVKLLENTFRMVNIGLVNEFALVCRRLGLDVWEIIDAASTKPFGFMPFRPGPGLGGHCIPVDPHYLAWKLRAHNFTTRFVELADAVNSAMPEHVVDVVTDALNDRERAVKGSRILALGAAYKPDISDVRESPALEVFEKLLHRGARLAYNDPHVPDVQFAGHAMTSVPLTAEALREADAVVILTDHKVYDWTLVLREARVIVDARNATASARAAAPELAGKVRRI